MSFKIVTLVALFIFLFSCALQGVDARSPYSWEPTAKPAAHATAAPTAHATAAPTAHATAAPTAHATAAPTAHATAAPTAHATAAPTAHATAAPTAKATAAPTAKATAAPTATATSAPTAKATAAPTAKATAAPTAKATAAPTAKATAAPTAKATAAPTAKATAAPTTAATSGDLCAITSTATEPLKILVPLYSYPGSDWDAVVTAAASGVQIIAIINPNSGPISTGPDSTWTTYMKKLANAGVEMVGYVHTSYGERAISDVTSEISTYASLYSGLSGIFLDEASADASEVSYYSETYTAIMAKSGFVHAILNPGTQPDEGYLAVSTNIVIFEDSGSNFASSAKSFASWVKCAPTAAEKSDYKYRFSAIAYGVTSSTASSLLSSMESAGVGLVYVTDVAGGCCTYNTLASYISTETSTVAALN